MSQSDPNESNRLIFKPSPLKELTKAARPQMAEAGQAGPSEVTAVPQFAASTPDVAEASRHDDLTTFSFEQLPATAPVPDSPQAKPPDVPPAMPAETSDNSDRVLGYVLLALAAGAILLALIWLGLV